MSNWGKKKFKNWIYLGKGSTKLGCLNVGGNCVAGTAYGATDSGTRIYH